MSVTSLQSRKKSSRRSLPSNVEITSRVHSTAPYVEPTDRSETLAQSSISRRHDCSKSDHSSEYHRWPGRLRRQSIDQGDQGGFRGRDRRSRQSAHARDQHSQIADRKWLDVSQRWKTSVSQRHRTDRCRAIEYDHTDASELPYDCLGQSARISLSRQRVSPFEREPKSK